MISRVTYPAWLRWGVIGLAVVLGGLNTLFPPPIKDAHNLSAVVNDHNGRWLAGFPVEDGRWRLRADIDEIDPKFIERLVAIEDSRFWNHSGVDIPAIGRALRSWNRAGKPVSGASTITMQLVRQIEPRPRTLRSKVIESFRAVQYELRLSKTDILELYLSHISYGGNIEGVTAAAWAYLGKSPDQLTDAEIALLIALPQAPEARRPDLNPKQAKIGRDRILDKLSKINEVDLILAAEAKAEPVSSKRHVLPENAWISAFGLKSERSSVRTTLDQPLQSKIETLSEQFIAPLDRPVNVAVTIVENKTMAVRAHIASADRSRPGGWIDMTERSRSPGSTLKPVIYGLAIDDGQITGGTLIDDAPTRFGNYQPENFNRRYHGKVRVHEALAHSLNVPAIAVLDQIGGKRFEETLGQTGIKLSRLGGAGSDTGLAIGLGGVGMTVNDLAVIYAALANNGRLKPLKWYPDDTSISGQLFSPEAAAEITRILRQAPTPNGRVPAWLIENAPPIAYKTGTSYGFRDAWAAGYTDDWTVIVWVGRADGAPRRGQTGRIAAAPFLFDIFALLPHRGTTLDFQDLDESPVGLQTLNAPSLPPQILFPPEDAELLEREFGAQSRGFTLSARAGAGDIRFYVNGERVPKHGSQSVWRPENPGFYTVSAVDGAGRYSSVEVEVVSIDQMTDSQF